MDWNLNENYHKKMLYLKNSRNNLIAVSMQNDGIENLDLHRFQNINIKKTVTAVENARCKRN